MILNIIGTNSADCGCLCWDDWMRCELDDSGVLCQAPASPSSPITIRPDIGEMEMWRQTGPQAAHSLSLKCLRISRIIEVIQYNEYDEY